jgi:autotransporter-associated beta strand protein
MFTRRFRLPGSALSFLATAALFSAVPLSAQTTIDYAPSENQTTPLDTSGAANPTSLNVDLGEATQSGAITGTGAIIKTGAGALILDADNDYSDGTTLEAGTLRLATFTALGTGALAIHAGTIGNSATDEIIGVSNDLIVTSDFAIDAQGQNGALEIFGDVDLGAATTRTITLAGEGLACFGGTLTGQNLTLLTTAASSQAMVCSNTSNALTGTVRVGSGITLELDKDAGFTAISGNLLIDAGAAVWLDQGNQFAAASDVVVNGTLVGKSADTNAINALTGSGTISATQSDTLEVNSGTFTGTITEEAGGDLALTKKSSGTLTLTGANTYTGATTIQGGKLIVNGSPHASSAVTIEAGGTLAGSGTVGALTVKSGGVISPGDGPGTLTSGSQTWEPGGTYHWEINDATGATGTATDWLNIAGDLVLSTSAGTPFTIEVTSLTLANVAGPAANFDPAADYTWTLATATSPITGFDPSHFIIDTSGFANAPGSDHFTLSTSGPNLQLTYSAVPEPAPLGFGFAVLCILGVLHRRSGRRPSPSLAL